MVNLFGDRETVEFERIQSIHGAIYLHKRGKLRVKENPLPQQEADRAQADLLWYVNLAAERCAKSLGVTEIDARKLFFSQNIDGVEIMPSETLGKWLSDGEQKELNRLQLQTTNKVVAATLMIRHRLGYHVEVNADAKAKSVTLTVDPLQTELPVGQKFKIKDTMLEIAEYAPEGSTEIKVKPAPKPILAGVGYLCDEHGSYRIGLPSWTEEQTGDLDLIDVEAIYQFYLREIGIGVNEGKSSPATNSETSPDQSLLTGGDAGKESEAPELQTPTSTTNASGIAIAA